MADVRSDASAAGAQPADIKIPQRSISRVAPPYVLTIAAASALVFAVVTYDVVNNGILSAQDVQAVAWLRARGNAPLQTVMEWASRSGGPAITSVYAAIPIVIYLTRRRVAAALTIAIVVYSGALLNVTMKHLVQRARPALESPLMTLPTYSFPSGHAVASTVFGGLIWILAWKSGLRGLRIGIIAASLVAWVALVGLSRVYLGVHYPTDVVAGTAEGVFWLAVWTIALDRIGLDLRWQAAHTTVST